MIGMADDFLHHIRDAYKVRKKILTQEYCDILVNSGGYTLVPITAPIAYPEADLRGRYNLRTPDTLHVAAAIDAGCDAMFTNDKNIRGVQELSILMLDELELKFWSMRRFEKHPVECKG